MYIKQIRLQGFKSYKDQIAVEPFSPEVNVVVGRNGSGKSNFFWAIQFVLSDKFSTLSQRERQQLLHEGVGLAVMSAFVEITFDNSDGRFPYDGDEVVIRRAIGLKKDEFYVGKKHVTKQEINSLLESAGFSRSNPYYIVQQGRINALTMMKDSERLELLKEVAGTNVYDDKRAASLRQMAEAEAQRAQTVDVLAYINERLAELESEKDELDEYQALDRKRRCLEFTIYDREYTEAKAKLDEIKSRREEMSRRSSSAHDLVLEAHDRLAALEAELMEAQTTLRNVTAEKATLDEERSEIITRRAKLELSVKDAQEALDRETTGRGGREAELASLEEEITAKNAELDALKPDFEAAVEREAVIKAQLADAEATIAAVYSKQGRSKQFESTDERDAWINEQLAEMEATAGEVGSNVARLTAEIDGMTAALEELRADVAERQSDITERRAQLSGFTTEFQEAKAQRDTLANERKDLWREETELDSALESTATDLRAKEGTMGGTMSKVLNKGLNAVRKIVDKHNIPGVYGPLIELFECDTKFATCVDVTAGNALFHIVVDTDETAAQILGLLNKSRSGRVTFMPLNRLNPSTVDMPVTQDVMPLINQLEFDEQFRPAVAQIFGKTLVCRKLHVAAEYARTMNLNCVTLNGDQVNRKGALTGGYVDKRESRLATMNDIKVLRAKRLQLQDNSTKLKSRIGTIDQEITAMLGHVQKVETERNRVRDTYEVLQQEVRGLTKRLKTMEEELESKQGRLSSLEATHRASLDSIERLRAELGTPLESDLTDEEQETVQTLTAETTELKKELITIAQRRGELELERNQLKDNLETNLIRRRDDLVAAADDADSSHLATTLAAREQELDLVSHSVERLTERRREVAALLDETTGRVAELRAERERLRQVDADNQAEAETKSKQIEKILNKRALLIEAQNDASRKVRDLGALPQGASDAYADMPAKKLLKALTGVNKKLKKYSHVNKKALDQYISFSEQRAFLQDRKAELDEAAECIHETIRVLDMRKDEAIARTFKGVSESFEEVFSELVPGGWAKLVMHRDDDVAALAEAAEEDRDEVGGSDDAEGSGDGGALVVAGAAGGVPPAVDKYVGIGIKVSFTGTGHSYTMQQLSGGQKSLLALALIFAIQRTDPAPFYIFDEIDQALDNAHRSAVAALIARQAQTAQFITTTFRPEIIDHASKFYRVSYSKKTKVSRVRTIAAEECRAFILAMSAEDDPLAAHNH